MDTETLVAFGSEVKSVEETDDAWRVAGYLVVFDSHDVSALRDKFTKSTDYDFVDGERTTVYYNHGLDGTLKRTKLGDGKLFLKDAGVWFEGEIRKRKDYLERHVERIAEGAKKGVFGLSSGVPAHLVERKAVEGGHEVLLWPLGKDCSITPTPAEPLTSCVSLKALLEEVQNTEAKAGRAISSSNHAQLCQMADGIRTHLHAMESFLETYAGAEQEDEGEPESEDGGEPEMKTATDHEISQAMARYVRFEAGLVGVTIA